MGCSLKTFSDKSEIASYCIEFLRKKLADNKPDNIFSIALSGGSTPESIYRLMGEKIGGLLRAHSRILQVDERMVPYNDPDSNQRMITESLITPAAVPKDRVLFIQTGLSHTEAADNYQQQIQNSGMRIISLNIPLIDCVFLGMGSDGHTASLFSDEDCAHKGTAAATIPAGLPYKRVSLTYPVLIHAEKIFFIITGEPKAVKLKELLTENGTFPAAKVRNAAKDVEILADTAAASLI